MATTRLPGTTGPVTQTWHLAVHEHGDGTVSCSGLPDGADERLSVVLRLRDLLGATVQADAAAKGVSDGLLWRRHAHRQAIAMRDLVTVELVRYAEREPVED